MRFIVKGCLRKTRFPTVPEADAWVKAHHGPGHFTTYPCQVCQGAHLKTPTRKVRA